MIIDFRKCRRIVVKVGTNSLTKKDGRLDSERIGNLVDQIAQVRKGKEIVLVTSGAVGAGIGELGLPSRPRGLASMQACAAVGQSVLMRVYHDLFAAHGIKIAQILLADEDFSNRKRYLNFRNTVQVLLEQGVLPIINENDVIATHELKVGDNDTLSAMIAANIDADLLLMLTDIDGLYDKDPRHKGAKILATVNEITPEIEKLRGKGKGYSVGGITTKITAAKIAMKAGVAMNLVNGSKKDIVLNVLDNKPEGTVFLPNRRHNSKEQWISFARPRGIISVDPGAQKAIRQGKSLLASGVTEVHGVFGRGDVIIIQGSKEEIGKGLSEYSSDELLKIKGKSSAEIEKLLGFGTAAVKRENFIIPQ